MAEEKEIEETAVNVEKKPTRKMNFVFEILKIKKQLRWVVKNMNIVLGTDKDNEYPVVKYYKGKLDPSGTVNVKDLIKKHETDSCYDICAYIPSKEVLTELAKDNNRFTKLLNLLSAHGSDSIVIAPGETIVVPTNVCFELPNNIECQCRPRSGLTSQGITIGWGTVDEDYRGDVGIIVTNINKMMENIKKKGHSSLNPLLMISLINKINKGIKIIKQTIKSILISTLFLNLIILSSMMFPPL